MFIYFQQVDSVTPGDTRRHQETPGDTRGHQETPGDRGGSMSLRTTHSCRVGGSADSYQQRARTDCEHSPVTYIWNISVLINNNQPTCKNDFKKSHSNSYCGTYKSPEIAIFFKHTNMVACLFLFLHMYESNCCKQLEPFPVHDKVEKKRKRKAMSNRFVHFYQDKAPQPLLNCPWIWVRHYSTEMQGKASLG